MDILEIIGDLALPPYGDAALRLRSFCMENRNSDPSELRLKWLATSGNDTIDRADEADGCLTQTGTNVQRGIHDSRAFYELAINQIEAYRKYSRKFPTLLSDDFSFLFPTLLSAEQASHEYIADFHASLISGGKSMLDLTAGLGVDFMVMALAMGHDGAGCVAIDMDEEKTLALKCNLRTRGLGNAEVICGESVSTAGLMDEEGRRFDLIFADPARRDSKGARLFDPAECSPDVIGNAGLLFRLAPRILVKNSPMLDVRQALKIFPDVSHIYVSDVRNECKEVLVEMRKGAEFDGVTAIDIDADGRRNVFTCSSAEFGCKYEGGYAAEEDIAGMIEAGKCYLYEPSAALMKLSPWRAVAGRFGLTKLSPNCHVFISGDSIDGFPGRRIKVESIVDRKAIKNLKGGRWNIVSRNYPLKAEQLAKKAAVKPSSDAFLYGLTVSQSETPLLLSGKAK